jgi:hypothetical protein
MTIAQQQINKQLFDTLNDEQRELFHKIAYCARKFLAGCESALEASVIMHHYDNGLIIKSEETESLILNYVKEKF